ALSRRQLVQREPGQLRVEELRQTPAGEPVTVPRPPFGLDRPVQDVEDPPQAAIPAFATSTTVTTARSTSSSSAGNWPSTQPVRISSSAPYTAHAASCALQSCRTSPRCCAAPIIRSSDTKTPRTSLIRLSTAGLRAISRT